MDDLRYEIYHQSKVSDLISLPLTSADLHLLILRCVYTTCIKTHCLQNVTVDLTNYGYEDKYGSLVSTYKSSQRVLCKTAVVKCAHTNTVHAEVLVSLAAFIANVKKTTSQVNSV